MKNFIEDFKAFAMKGNVVDLAIAVVIGAAFGKIVSSLVDNIITPIVGMLLGGVNFSDLAITIGAAQLTYGAFIQAVVDFLIVALVLFVVIKMMSKLQKKEEEKPKEEKAVETELDVLKEIRESLKK
jgi:large conductance mechanosensitive channel